jgi:hypothetical protein
MKSLRDEICLAAGDAGEYFTFPPLGKEKNFPSPPPLHRLPQIVIRQLAQYPFSAANPPSFPLGFHTPQGYDTGTTNIRI